MMLTKNIFLIQAGVTSFLLLALAVPYFSRSYILSRIRYFERIDLPGAAEEAVRLRAKVLDSWFYSGRFSIFACRDIGRRMLTLSYRLGW